MPMKEADAAAVTRTIMMSSRIANQGVVILMLNGEQGKIRLEETFQVLTLTILTILLFLVMKLLVSASELGPMGAASHTSPSALLSRPLLLPSLGPFFSPAVSLDALPELATSARQPPPVPRGCLRLHISVEPKLRPDALPPLCTTLVPAAPATIVPLTSAARSSESFTVYLRLPGRAD